MISYEYLLLSPETIPEIIKATIWGRDRTHTFIFPFFIFLQKHYK